MLSSLWGWIYRTISLPIKQRLTISERRFNALIRLLRHRYESSYVREVLSRYERFGNNQGIKNEMGYTTRIITKVKYWRSQYLRDKAGIVTVEEKQAVQRNMDTLHTLVRILIPWLMGLLAYQSQLTVFKIVDGITVSLFSGRIGRTLFILGFVLWNLSKALSLSIAQR
jgi:hypothetical protein